MNKLSFKKLVSAVALSMSLALTVPAFLPVANTVTTVEAASPSISKKSAKLRAGENLKLTIKNKGKKSVKWTTSNKKVATVKKGVVTATGTGKAVITANVGEKKLKCTVKVSNNSYTITPYFHGVMRKDFVSNNTFGFIPTKVYYKNGKLYCKTELYNKTGYKIKSLKSKKYNVTLAAYSILSDTTTEIVNSKMKIKFPTEIKNNKTKSFTIEFSGKQIKKKGFDLSSVDLMGIDFGEGINYTYYIR